MSDPNVTNGNITVHLCCTPWLTWCHANARRVVSITSSRSYAALPRRNRCEECDRLWHQWSDPQPITP